MKNALEELISLEDRINQAIVKGYGSLRSMTTDLEEILYQAILKVIKEFKDGSANGFMLDDVGALLNNAHNKNAVLLLANLIELSTLPIVYDTIISETVRQMELITTLSQRYFQLAANKSYNLLGVSYNARKSSMNAFGIYDANDLTAAQKASKLFTKTTQGAYIKADSFLGNKKIIASAKNELTTLFTNALIKRQDFFEFKDKYLKSNMVTKRLKINGSFVNHGGVIDKNYSVTAWETLTGHTRVNHLEMSKALDLGYAVYQGTKRETSRAFCVGGIDNKTGVRHSGLLNVVAPISTFKQIAHKSGTWAGKYPTGHDITKACGGFRCYHYLRYISKDMYDYYLSLSTTVSIIHSPSNVPCHKI